MRRLFSITLFLSACIAGTAASAQSDEVWTLQRCVQYAVDHNISIQQNVLNERLSKLTLLQSRLSQIPSANGNVGAGRSFGRSIDPTTNQFVDGSYDFTSISGTSNVLLFGWFQTRNTISKNKYALQAAQADLDQLKNDVSLNVATGFLRSLLAQEQIKVNEKQVELSKAQLDQTRKFATAGRVPELNVAQLESQLATDSSNLISAISDYNASILDLKALLNLDFALPFAVQPPQISIADQISLNDLNPEMIFVQASKHFGAMKSSEFKVSAAKKALAASKGALYPQLGLTAQLGTNSASTYKEVAGFNNLGYQQSVAYVDIDGNKQYVYQPNVEPIYTSPSIGKQWNNNFRQTVSINLNIPLFNAWQSSYMVQQNRINVASSELNQYQTQLKLKQDIYKAYNDARNSIQKYNAAQRAADAATRAYVFAQKRYDLGLTNTIEYLTTQNNQYRADASLLSAKYDLIFRLKVIDYYLGKELKL